MSSVLQSCCDSSYIFSKKRTPSEKKCNNHAKIIITPVLYRRATLETHLEPSRRSTMENFCKNNQRLKVANNFHKSASSQMFGRVLNTPLSSEKCLQECEYMANSSSLII